MNGKELKAQSATEFIIYTSIAMLVLTVLVGAIAGKQQDVATMQKTMQAEEIAETIAAELDTAIIMGEGYEREMQIPNNINGEEYTVDADGGYIIVEWVDEMERSRVVPTKFTGDLPINSNITRTYRVSHTSSEGVQVEPITD